MSLVKKVNIKHECDGCHNGPFLAKEVKYEYGLLLCPTCLQMLNYIIRRRSIRKRIRLWSGTLKELLK